MAFELQNINSNRYWAIQNSDSEHRTWKEKETASLESKSSKLVFDWEDIKVSAHSTYKTILNAVDQSHNTLRINDKKNIARGIYNISKLRVGDGVLAVEGGRAVKQAGFVENNQIDDFKRHAEIDITWTKNFEEANATKNIFRIGEEVQKITPKLLTEIQSFLPLVGRSSRNGIVRDSDFEISMIQDKEEKSWTSQKEDFGGKVKLFFGTNRNRSNSSKLNEYFGDNIESLKYGICNVSIPRGHVQGKIEKPWGIFRFRLPENPDKHIVIDLIEDYNQTEFLDMFNKAVDINPNKDALIFIHGYNNSFAEGAKKAAQLIYDIPFYGLASYFSWASAGKLDQYDRDKENVITSTKHFSEFVEKILLNTKIEKLHLVAHSLGNTLLSFTLKDLSNNRNLVNNLDTIQQIVMGAADLGQALFEANYLQVIKQMGLRRTLYSSENDISLKLSHLEKKDLLRLGEAGNNLFVADGIDTIDATNVKSDLLGHNYIFDTKELLADLFLLINNNSDPEKRRLKARENRNKLIYWLFPE